MDPTGTHPPTDHRGLIIVSAVAVATNALCLSGSAMTNSHEKGVKIDPTCLHPPSSIHKAAATAMCIVIYPPKGIIRKI